MSRLGILPRLAGAALLWAVCGNMLAGAERAATPSLPQSGAVMPAQVKAAMASWPLRFEENVGQVQGPEGQDVRFISHGSGYTLFLTSTEAVLELGRRSPGLATATHPVVLRMRLAGGSKVQTLTGQDKLPGKSNYLLGNDPAKWRTVANCRQISTMDVYPGIDLVYHGNEGQLEYDFEVAPQANPRQIRLALQGAQRWRVDSQGDLVVKVEGGELRFRRPVAYQKVEGSRRRVPVNYILKAKNQVEFRLGSYDRRQSLVIDPILSYSTYVGGSSIDSANAIAVAPDGTAFIAGGTFSADFPTVHPLQPNAGGPHDFPQDAFVSKISADGSTLLYSTYLGGKNEDVANGIAVDAAGEAFVVGTTLSPDFPVTPGSFNTLCGGDGYCGATWNPSGFIVSNAFVAKLNTAGSGLVYSGFLGYYENVEGLGIAVDGALNAYVTGAVGPNIQETVPLVPPETPPPPFCAYDGNGFQTAFGGSGGTEFGGSGTDAFIVKIDASASQLLYCSYLGGSDEDVGYGVAVDTNANAYVAGLTYSTDLPITNTATYTSPLAPLQAAYAGAGDAFLSKVNTDATGAGSLVYSTYLGGAGIDQGNAVAVDSSGNAYLTGLTTSASGALGFTPPAGSYQTNCTLDSLNVCEGDAFIAKFNPSLSGPASLLYFTWLGGSLADSGTGIAVDATGNIFATGSTVSTNFPIAGPVFQPQYGGGNADAFITELNPANPPATALIYSTYLGGSNTDVASGIAIDSSDSAYVAGQSCSLDFSLANPLQPTYGGNCDAFVSKIIESGGVSLNPAGLVFGSQDVGSQSPAQTVTLTNGANVALAINGVTLTGDDSADFALQSNACVSSVPALGTCTMSVTFTPTSITPPARTAKITLTDTEAGDSQESQVIDLTGTAGSAPILSLSPANLNFSAQQAVGVTSAPLTLTVTNTGTAALATSSIVASGDFAVQGNNCTAPLQATTPPSNCTITVTFTPTQPGSSVGSLTLTDNAPNSPQVILLSGTGVTAPIAILSPLSVTFTAAQAIGSTSTTQAVTLTNTGSAPLLISNIAVAGTNPNDFGTNNTCGASVAAGANCSISVTFTPTAVGARYGMLTVTDNNNGTSGSTQTVPLEGTGQGGPVASLSPSTLTFASQPLQTTSASQSITLTNSGTASMTGISIAVAGTNSAEFSVTGTCSATLAAGASCTINVTFTPTTTGLRTASVAITDSAPNSPQVVTLTGGGADFGISINPTSAIVVAGNSTTVTLTVNSVSGFDAAVSLTCSGLPALATCSASPSAVTPSGSSATTSTLTISTTRRTSTPPGGLSRPQGPGWMTPPVIGLLWGLLLLGLSVWAARRNRLRWSWAVLALTAILLASFVACGAAGTGYVNPTGTPSGNYTIVVTGASASLTHTANFTLTVQ